MLATGTDLSSRYLSPNDQPEARRLFYLLSDIQTSFLGITSTGVFLHFLSSEPFPENLFSETDRAMCRVHFRYLDNDQDFCDAVFWLEFSRDQRRRRFYFTPPRSLNEAALFGRESVLNEKEHLFHELKVNINIRGLNRNLVLRIDREWLDVLRHEYGIDQF